MPMVDSRDDVIVRQRCELDALRLSVRRVAEFVGIDPSEIPHHSISDEGPTAERGWNRLCGVIINCLEAEHG